MARSARGGLDPFAHAGPDLSRSVASTWSESPSPWENTSWADAEQPERLFVAGLLHDVGSPVIYTQLPELASAMRGAADNDECALWHAEGLHLGFTHAHVGALLLEAWELPSRLLNAVLHHHDLQGPVDGAQESAALHLADGLASQVAAGAFFDGLSLESVVDPRAWEVLNLSPEVLSDENFAGSIETQFKELIAVFLRG